MPSAAFAFALQLALAPEARTVDTSGEWILFESQLPVVSPWSREVALPSPPPESLRHRLLAVAARLNVPLDEKEIAPVVPPGP